MILLLLACGSDPQPDAECDGLYGAPNENTGVSEDECVPAIGGWTPKEWTAQELATLRGWTLVDPPGALSSDPYAVELDELPGEELVCGAVFEGSQYRLQTFADVEALQTDDAVITHGGPCGLCSSLEDLAVYASESDLTQPVRECGLEAFSDGVEAAQECLEELGFTPACASIWAYNVENTRAECQSICLEQLNDPYLTSDGALNECLQCDEDHSGPVFKAVAGRTRRNSGLASALCRPCETVWRIDHDYPSPE